ncbi:hypothetical protein GQR36_13940 [Enterococcus termitis]
MKLTTSLQEALTILTRNLLDSYKEPTRLILKEVQLTETEHLGEEFQRSYENGELLAYLQATLLSQTNQELFLFQIKLGTHSAEEKALITAAPELLQQLEKNYLQSEIFSNTLQELTQNPAFTSVVPIDNDWRERSIEEADQKIKEDFVIQEDQT